jgi:hypothetical protein
MSNAQNGEVLSVEDLMLKRLNIRDRLFGTITKFMVLRANGVELRILYASFVMLLSPERRNGDRQATAGPGRALEQAQQGLCLTA